MTKPMYVFGGIGVMFLSSGAAIILFVIYRKLTLGGIWISPLFFIGILLSSLAVISFLMGLLADIIMRFYFELFPDKIYLVKKSK